MFVDRQTGMDGLYMGRDRLGNSPVTLYKLASFASTK